MFHLFQVPFSPRDVLRRLTARHDLLDVLEQDVNSLPARCADKGDAATVEGYQKLPLKCRELMEKS